MTPYYDDGKGIVIYNGDNASVMPTLAKNSVDAIVTDPPYGISFMGTVCTVFKKKTGHFRKKSRAKTRKASFKPL